MAIIKFLTLGLLSYLLLFSTAHAADELNCKSLQRHHRDVLKMLEVLKPYRQDIFGPEATKKGQKIANIVNSCLANREFCNDIQIQEMLYSLCNGQRYPTVKKITMLKMPGLVISHKKAEVGGKKKSGDLIANDSTFWQQMDIEKLDLSHAFGRNSQFKDMDFQNCHYKEAKTNYGNNAGFTIECGKKEYKLKFNELKSEPFAARIFWALGFNVGPTDYISNFTMQDDERIYSEINLSEGITSKVVVAFMPVYTIRPRPTYDAHDFVKSTANGKVTFHAVNIQAKDKDWVSFGPWDYAQLEHNKKQELRGLGLLAAWLGWFDARFDNARLKVQETASGINIRHVISDLGSALGSTTGLTYRKIQDASVFPDKLEISVSDKKVKIKNFTTVSPNQAFKEMTYEDGLWMAKLISRLSENQIQTAMQASGFEGEEYKIFFDKIAKRRDDIMCAFGLVNSSVSLWSHNKCENK